MTQHRYIAPFVMAGLLALATSVSAEDSFAPDQSYGEKVRHKALNATANMTTSILEVPKNVINTTNDSNLIYGLTGGLFKGVLNMLGRVGVGVADFVTIPLATKPITYPVYVWDDFDVDTTYGDTFRLDPSATPAPKAPQQTASLAEPAPVAPEPVKDYSDQYQDEYPNPNEKLDTLFEKQMMK
ncbi:MAG: exosortase system-associated protein, TIGR04073 family [Gammaproteobacteria bacterium]